MVNPYLWPTGMTGRSSWSSIASRASRASPKRTSRAGRAARTSRPVNACIENENDIPNNRGERVVIGIERNRKR